MPGKYYNKKKIFEYSRQEIIAKLETLEDAISDVGYWNWWTSEFPEWIMLEFGGVQIWTNPKDKDSPPSGRIAITFENPISVSFLTRNRFPGRETPVNWTDLLHNDQLEPPEIERGQFTLTNMDTIQGIIKQAHNIETILGISPENAEFYRSDFQFGFWAVNFGCVISCNSFNLVSSDGELSLEMIEDANEKWWEYWKEYWRKKQTNEPLPEDYACEVTIPADNNWNT